MCEQISSISSSTYLVPTDLVHITIEANSISAELNQRGLTKCIKAFKHNLHFKYVHFRSIFQNENPIYWFFPFQLDDFKKNKINSEENQRIDIV